MTPPPAATSTASDASSPGEARSRSATPEPPTRLETRALGRRIVAGDPAAFGRLAELHGGRLLAIARRRLASAEDARDVVQETFLRAWRHRASFDPARPVEPWLTRILVNLCRDRRQRARDRSGPLAAPLSLDSLREDGAPEPPDDAPDPARTAAASQRVRQVADALAALPEQQRTALVLRDVEGLTTREVAARLGVSEPTVRSHVSRARLALRRQRRHLDHLDNPDHLEDLDDPAREGRTP